MGWGESRELSILACAWRNQIEDIRPDAMICDHAPTALLASRGLDFPLRRIVLGSGFCCPPDTSPLPMFATDEAPDMDTVREDEQLVLRRANHVLAQWGRAPLQRLGQLYGEVDETFLTTFEELEQYPGRTGARYWGPVMGTGGNVPAWPDAKGPKVFAYLKRFAGLPELLALLNERRLPTVAYMDGIDAAMRRKFESPTLRFERQRVDVGRAAAECDLAILHAGQGTTAAMLLAGKAVLQLPIVVEQRLTADATVRLGAGERAAAGDAGQVGEKLGLLLADGRYAEAAGRFAAKYADFDPAAQVERMVGRVEELLEPQARRPTRDARPAANLPPANVLAGAFRV